MWVALSTSGITMFNLNRFSKLRVWLWWMRFTFACDLVVKRCVYLMFKVSNKYSIVASLAWRFLAFFPKPFLQKFQISNVVWQNACGMKTNTQKPMNQPLSLQRWARALNKRMIRKYQILVFTITITFACESCVGKPNTRVVRYIAIKCLNN